MKGVHVIRNAAPREGSAADPVPAWAWIFMITCGFIPVISLGGALPAVIAACGISAARSLARNTRWPVALRAGAGLTLVCWLSFARMVSAFRKPAQCAQPAGWSVPAPKAMFMNSSPEKLMDEIEENYTKQGYRPEAISPIKDTLRQNCDRWEKKQRVAYLRTALIEAQTSHPN
jgi:hypothetical protein